MPSIDDRIEEYQNTVIEFFKENEPFFVNYIGRPWMYEVLFHTEYLPRLRYSILILMLTDRFFYHFNRRHLKGLQLVAYTTLFVTPFFIESNPYINLTLYAILSDNDTFTGLSQAILGYIATHQFGIFTSVLLLAVSNIVADSYKIVYLLNNNQRFLFYISWNQLRGYTLKAIVNNYYRETREFMDTIIGRALNAGEVEVG